MTCTGLFALTAALLTGCGPRSTSITEAEPALKVERIAMENDLLEEWEGPYGGVPAFDEMDLEELRPAM